MECLPIEDIVEIPGSCQGGAGILEHHGVHQIDRLRIEIISGVDPLDSVGDALNLEVFIIECTTITLQDEIIPLCLEHQGLDGDALGHIHPLGEVNDLILVEVIPLVDGDFPGGDIIGGVQPKHLAE